MHDQDSSGRQSSPPFLEEDLDLQRSVLRFVLDDCPITDAELALAMITAPGDFEATDAHHRAVRDLIHSGLLRREGGQLWPTRPSRCVAEIGGLHE